MKYSISEPVKVCGSSDDLVELENSAYKQDEIDCYNHDVRLTFSDGTVIRIGYPKKNIAVWWIKVEEQGIAYQKLTVCNDEEADVYSDVFEIFSDIVSHEVIRKEATDEK